MPLSAPRLLAAVGAVRHSCFHWVRPEMVVEVSYIEWTPDGLSRHVVFLGERRDNRARCDPVETDLTVVV
jgi:ATP-dependent DNA ligase